MDSLHDRLQWIYRQTAVHRAPMSLTEHEALVEAITVGDSEAAGHAAHAHVGAARETALRHSVGSVSATSPEPPGHPAVPVAVPDA